MGALFSLCCLCLDQNGESELDLHSRRCCCPVTSSLEALRCCESCWHIRPLPAACDQGLTDEGEKTAGLLLPGGITEWYHFHCRVLWEMSLRPDKIHLQPTPVPRFSLPSLRSLFVTGVTPGYFNT